MGLIERLNAIGDAIREKNGTTELIPLVDMPQAILDISGGGTELAVEYIESTGTQYIDTGIIPTNHRLKIKFQKNDSLGSSIFGSYGTTALTDSYELTWYQGKWYYSNGQKNTNHPTIPPAVTEVVTLDYFTFDNKVIMNGNEVGSTLSSSVSINPLYLFGKNATYQQLSSMKLWYAQIYDRETQQLVRDFVPAIDENGVICLYDNVTKAYFYNQGEGEFIGGFVESELAEIENLIDESGVLEDTEGTATEKVEQLIENSKTHNLIQDGFDRVGFTGANASSNGIFASQIWAGSMPLFDYENVTTLYRLCYGNINITEIELKNTHNNKNATQIFHSCANLSKVVGLDFTSVEDATNSFFNCSSLKDITFVAKTIKVDTSFAYSPLLTNESKQSIFDGLATVETAQTITFHKDVKILQAQVDSANAKGWTVAGGTVVSEEEYYG